MGPLDGIKVVEMAGLAPGPYAAMLLADLGADVLRIDRPTPLEANVGLSANILNRNRMTLPIDVKSAEGKSTLIELISKADALIEGYRPGVMEKLGLGPDECFAKNPKLVYGRITGWGQDGPLAQAAGHDLNYLAITGALHSMGTKESIPPIPLNLLGDFAGGGMLLALGILAGVIEAKTSGKGQVVDASMVDGVSSIMTYIHSLRASNLWSDERGENVLDGSAPYYGVYETLDGKFITVAAAEQKFYAELILLMGLESSDLPKQNDRQHWPALRVQFEQIFKSKTQTQWIEIMQGTDSCFAPVLSIPEALEHPHNTARGTYIEVDGVPQPAPVPRFSRSHPKSPTPPAYIAGQHQAEQSQAKLAENWGLSPSRIQQILK